MYLRRLGKKELDKYSEGAVESIKLPPQEKIIVLHYRREEGFYKSLFNSLKGSSFHKEISKAWYVTHDINGKSVRYTGDQIFQRLDYDLQIKSGHLSELNQRINSTIQEIREEYYKQNSEIKRNLKLNGQPVALALDSETALILVRSMLDIIACLTYLFYYPNERGFTKSFHDQLKKFANDNGVLKSLDPDYSKLLMKYRDWFEKLRLYRDFVTHIGSFIVFMEKTKEGARFNLIAGAIGSNYSTAIIPFEDIRGIINNTKSFMIEYTEFFKSKYSS